MVLICYLDDAGTDEISKFVSLSGYLGTVDAWAAFENEANDVMATFETSYIRGRDLWGTRGDFKNWSMNKKIEFIEALNNNFIKVGEGWLIVLSAKDTKERRPDERPIPTILSRHIEIFLKTYRPAFSYAGKELWVGTYGRPLSYSAIERIVTETTRQTLGIPISPHLFRSCAASSAYMHARATPNLASAVLNHRGSRTTQEHYNRSKSAFYGHEFGSLLDNL